MQSIGCIRWWFPVLLVLLGTGPAFAQTGSTFNGQVMDQGAAVLPGVTITVTNVSTGVVRTTVTNEQGQYSVPGLEPGTYNIATELSGFAPVARNDVRLTINATITVDFQLKIAGVQETLTVTGEAPLIETTQSKVANTIETTELQNLPMVTRNISGMLQLLPGATPVQAIHRTKENQGSVSFGGAMGGNVASTVDGADNKDYHYRGPLLTFTTESLEQFQLSTSQFSAVDGRSNGAAVSLVTKSGTNALHGSGFVYERDRKLTATDYFTEQANRDKVPFSRQQFGASIGGPIVQNRAFFFGAVEQQLEDTGRPVADSVYNELSMLLRAEQAGQIPKGMVNPNLPRFVPQPGGLRMYSIKSNLQLNNAQSLTFRYAGMNEGRDAVTYPAAANNDNREPDNFTIDAFSVVAQHSWILGNNALNQITGQVNHVDYLADVVSNITGDHYTRDFPNVNYTSFSPALEFPSVNTGAAGDAGTMANRSVYQIRNDASVLRGSHSVKFGANFNVLKDLGILNGNEHFATITFFDNPSVIFNNTNGRYPQGFNTPGIVSEWSQANGGAINGQGSWANTVNTAYTFATWFQDDWRATPNLTLNLGLRYDLDLEMMDQKHFSMNATRQILEAIGNPYGGYPETPKRDISPRIGFAYDLTGEGRRVLRGGYGFYFDQYNTGAAAGDITSQARRPLNALATLTNTAFGVGELARYRFGIDPVPAQPTEGNEIPIGAEGQWIDPAMIDPRAHQIHVGYAHELWANTTLSVDFSHHEVRNEKRQININPIINGQRRLAPDFQRVFGIPDRLSNVLILAPINEARYDALTFLVQRRTPRATLQAHYTLSSAYAYGGTFANFTGGGNNAGGGSSRPMIWDQPNTDEEWGPAQTDERHRFVFLGVFELPYGLQVSPVIQAASARPYNLIAGTDLNRDGLNNDRYIDPNTGQQVHVNAGRGDNTFLFDLRTTKFLSFGGGRQLGLFFELFNVLNTVNHGNLYNGNGRAANFRQPTGYIQSIGYPRQLQLGARFLF
jgi:hypothetical protein